MSYTQYRIFCAPAGSLDQERDAFYKVVGQVNEELAMPRDVLLVSVALPPSCADKRGFQGAIDENIRACTFYIQLVEDTWGPPQLNWEREYALANRCVRDSEMPMKEVLLLFKTPLLPHRVEPEIQAMRTAQAENLNEFETLEEFNRILRAKLTDWLERVAPQ